MKPCRQFGNTSSMPASCDVLQIYMTRPRVQSCSTAVQETDTELQLEPDKGQGIG